MRRLPTTATEKINAPVALQLPSSALTEKVMSMAEAIERFVPNGATVAMGTALEALIPFAARRPAGPSARVGTARHHRGGWAGRRSRDRHMRAAGRRRRHAQRPQPRPV